MKNKKNYFLDQSRLYKVQSKKKLSEVLNIDIKIFQKLDSFISYKSYDKKEKNKIRKITYPNSELKEIQKKIFKLLKHVERPKWLISGEIGKSATDNAKMHLHLNDELHSLMLDIRNFYPSCTREYVYQFFLKKLKTSKDVASILTDLTTYENTIPTGCPTSQLIAYYAYEDMFLEIAKESKDKEIIFSLFVDDMTFSAEKLKDIKYIKNRIDIILRKYGHRPKYKKTKEYSPKDYKPITGSIVTPSKDVKIPNRHHQEIYTLFNELKKNNSEVVDVKLIKKILGKINAARQIEKYYAPQMYNYCTNILQYDSIINSFNNIIESDEKKNKDINNLIEKITLLNKKSNNIPQKYRIHLSKLKKNLDRSLSRKI